jgi:2-oxoglutarate ferredoxin oxidoreductase subunit alpha
VYDSFSVLVGGKAGDGINEAGNLIARLMNRLGYRVYVEVDYPSLIRGGHNFSIVRCAREKVGCRTDRLDVVMALNDETVERHAHRLGGAGTLVIDTGSVKSVTPDEADEGDDDPSDESRGGDRKADGARGGSGQDDSEEGDAERIVMGVPIAAILKELQAPPVMRNTCLLGAFCRIAGISWEILDDTIRQHIPRSLEKNLEVARRGYEATRQRETLASLDLPALPVMNGNEAVGLGLIRAGCTAYVAYPMSPSTGLLHFMASVADDCRLKVVHPENEIAVILMALGMAYAGERAAVGTAGGGFCLMTEGVSLAGQAELPIVIMVAQRPGPSTGLPTYTTQADLHFVLNAGQGEFPRLVVAPGSAEEAYYWSAVAMGLAWRYQTPAFVLADKAVCEGSYSIDIDALPPLPEYDVPLWDGVSPYRRYARPDDPGAEATGTATGTPDDAAAAGTAGESGDVSTGAPADAAATEPVDASGDATAAGTPTAERSAAPSAAVPPGVSPLAFPPLPGEVVKVDSYEHDELGVTTEDNTETVLMEEKRVRKWCALEEEIDRLEAVKVRGDADAPTALLCWGSNGSVCREVADELGLRMVQPLVLSPFPTRQFEEALDGVERLICVENNVTGQLVKLLRLHGFDVDDAIRRYDGRMFSLEELTTGVKEVLQ